jgi:hypothetical protein
VIIRRSESLRRMDAVRVTARVYPEPLGGGGQRMNIVEGQLSFALFTNPNLSLSCTFLDPAGNWVGATSAPNAIQPFRWSEVEFRYDGVSVMEQFINGAMTAARYDLRGPVRGIGPNGIYVGQWPEPTNRYAFRGYITDVEVWRREPRRNLDNPLNPCCLDERDWRRQMRKFQEGGYDRQYLDGLQRSLRDLEEEFLLKMRGDTAAGVAAERQVLGRLSDAIRQRDYAGLGAMLPDVANWVLGTYSQAELLDFGDRARQWVDTLPVDHAQLEQMARDACLGDLIDTMRTAAEREAKRRRDDQA